MSGDEMEDEKYSSSNGDEDFYPGNNDDFLSLRPQNSIIFLTTKDIFPRIEKKVKAVQELLNFTYDEALIILHYFKWSSEKIETLYLDNPEKYQIEAGLRLQHPPTPQNSLVSACCSICLNANPNIILYSALECNHVLCHNCWTDYINFLITDFSISAFWRCPFDKCPLLLRHSFIMNNKSPDFEEKYKTKLCKVFAEENQCVKWCPAPNCIYCVENVHLNRDEIKCLCNTFFCFKCAKESHKPCSCSQVIDWELRNSSESENLRWILVNTKLCPSCRKPIEKNQGCNHMTCRSIGCKYEFCWLCMGPWTEHGSVTGGFYKCNKFDEMSVEEKQKSNKQIDKEKSTLEKFIFYFDRFHNNRKAEEKAKLTYSNINNLYQKLHDEMKYDTSELQFLLDSGEFLIQARKNLKYTYVYGFFLDGEKQQKEKDLFEFNQAYFESNCEKLHELLEKKGVEEFFDNSKREFFYKYKQELIDITQATKKFMNRLLASLETGILETKVPAFD